MQEWLFGLVSAVAVIGGAFLFLSQVDVLTNWLMAVH
jgi:hypothetical protein